MRKGTLQGTRRRVMVVGGAAAVCALNFAD
jgi:hypothetical protein